MQEQKKEKLKILVIYWLIILGVYLFVRLMFIMFGLHLNNTLLRICLAIFPCLLGGLYLYRVYKQESIGFYSLTLIVPSIIEKIVVYLLGAYLYDISSLNMIKVMDMIGSNQPYVNVDVSQSICYLVNLSFFNWSYIILSIVFSCSCVFFWVKICKEEYVKLL